MTKSLGYLSGAPRVATSPDAEAAGPRSHILGVIQAFKSLGWNVKPFIVGDRMPAAWRGNGAAARLRKACLQRAAADCVRLGLGAANAFKALRQLGRVDMAYERFASFQALGRRFHCQDIPWVVETQGLFYDEARKDRKSVFLSPLARHIEKWTYKHCDAIVCVSEVLKTVLLENVSLEPDKIIVIPNGVDTDYFDPDKYAAIKIMDKALVIGFVGSLIGWQGLGLLIEALSSLRKEGMDFGLVVVGDGAMRAEWQELARNCGMNDSIYFTGLVPYTEVPKYIAGFNIGYSGQVPMKVGGMYCSPLKLYEYMAMGVPVIAAAYQDALNTVIHGETGYLFPPEDRELLKMVLRRAYREKVCLSEMGQKARKAVQMKHTWIYRVQTIIQEVQKVLGARSCKQ